MHGELARLRVVQQRPVFAVAVGQAVQLDFLPLVLAFAFENGLDLVIFARVEVLVEQAGEDLAGLAEDGFGAFQGQLRTLSVVAEQVGQP